MDKTPKSKNSWWSALSILIDKLKFDFSQSIWHLFYNHNFSERELQFEISQIKAEIRNFFLIDHIEATIKSLKHRFSKPHKDEE
jgi:hypothetical protein